MPFLIERKDNYMLNNVVLVGRLVEDPELLVSDNGSNKRTSITVAVPRPFKNSEGIYETDFIKCVLWNNIAEHTVEYCKKGDIVGIKGRVQNNNYEKDGKKYYELEVVTERVTFLSNSREKHEYEK